MVASFKTVASNRNSTVLPFHASTQLPSLPSRTLNAISMTWEWNLVKLSSEQNPNLNRVDDHPAAVPLIPVWDSRMPSKRDLPRSLSASHRSLVTEMVELV